MALNPLPRLPPSPTTYASNLEIATLYAKAGLPVFPCQVGGKTPLTKHGFHDATTNLSQVKNWWSRHPEANIGVATGVGVDVVDVDLRDTGSGFPVLEDLKTEGLVDGWVQAVRTPSGGLHLYFPSDPDCPQRSWSRGKVHVDFRGTGGYIIAPGSTIPQGRRMVGYEILATRPAGSSVDGERIRSHLTPAPTRTHYQRPDAHETTRQTARQQAQRLAVWVGGLQEGERNNGLFWAACRLVELGVSETDIHGWLGPPGQQIGLHEGEVRAVITSALSTTNPSQMAVSPVPSRVLA